MMVSIVQKQSGPDFFHHQLAEQIEEANEDGAVPQFLGIA